MDEPQTQRWFKLGRMTRAQLAQLHARYQRETGARTLIPTAPFRTWKKHDMISYFMWGGAEHWDWEAGPTATPRQPAGPAMAPDAGCDSGTGTDSNANRANGENS